jgi:hypothetical protein
MTVAAVVVADSPEDALGDAAGQGRVRRIADVAWAGGALPIVVVAADPDGAVAAALTGATAALVGATPGAGPAGALLAGAEVAAADVSGVDAVLVWPARFAWVDPETVTSLIEAHGTRRDSVLVAAFGGEPGWPRLVPLDRLRAMDPGVAGSLDDALAGVQDAGPTSPVELGDPGATNDASTPREHLPAFEGPAEPASGHVHEWGAAVPDEDDDAEPGLRG